jgi:hypothetical protein
MDTLRNMFSVIDPVEYFEWLRRNYTDDDLIEIIRSNTGFEVFESMDGVLDEIEQDVITEYLGDKHNNVVFCHQRELDDYVEENALINLTKNGVQHYRREDCVDLLNEIAETRGWEHIFSALNLIK